ncbi:SusC/RagA family TonB-linked outer membrane protein [Mucilaginibacter sp. AW1-7]|uniref:SusC/RagA family TonB-linked outer membrane protein n=1 Tax=Mucilaginibacter sp. AW1-7 TaxID=3349874 RepID=UPI003F73CD34
MKLTTFVLVIALVQASAASFAQKINLNETNAPLEKVITAIKQQSGYVFLYTDQQIKNERITVKVNNASIEETLKAAFANTSVDYKIVGNNVLLKKNEPTPLEEAKSALAQITIRGKVVDETGSPLAGASVTEKGTTNGTRTDKEGVFSLTLADDNKIITFSFVGYEPIELRAKDITSGGTITLKASTTNLKEVVVNKGYYTTTQLLNTGNVTKINGDDIKKQPVSDPLMALEGRVPGLQISQSSGIPGAYSTVRIRGQNSIANGNKPLYIVDGVPYSATSMTSVYITGGAVSTPTSVGSANTGSPEGGLSPFNNLSPTDIESIEVLKDADATAIYGSRGANGVILITTRKGKSGDTKVDVDISSAFGTVARTMEFMNTEQYLDMRRQAFTNDGKLPSTTDLDLNGTWDQNSYTDWQKVLTGGTSRFDNIQTAISGGDTNTKFRIGGTTSKQTTVFPGEFSDQKASLSLNLDHVSSNGKLHILFSGNFVHDINKLPTSDFSSDIFIAPNSPSRLLDNNGNLIWTNIPGNNPFSRLKSSYQATTNNLIGNTNLTYKVLPNLEAKVGLGYSNMQLNQNNIVSAVQFRPPNDVNPSLRQHDKATKDINTWIIEPQVNYNTVIFSGKLSVLVGSTFQQNKQSDYGLRATNFSTDDLVQNFALGSTLTVRGNSSTLYHYSAIYARLGYNLKDKYLLNLTARRDGSSRFGPENQFGNFGAVGAGWIFSEENFIKNALPFLSFGKLRGSYGSTGNDQLTDYAYMSTYAPYTSSTYQGVTTLNPTGLTNPYYGWETVKKLEGGLEIGFLKDRINLNISYYRNRTVNQLVGYALPSTTGFTTITANLPAVVENSGVEFEINTLNIQSRKFKWTTSFNISVPRNRLVSYPGLASSSYRTLYQEGKSLFIQRKYHATGVNPQTGLYTFEDVNKDGIINTNDNQFLKEITQNYYGGFDNTLTIGDFQLSVNFQFVKQTGIEPTINFPGSFGSGALNMPTYISDAWRSPGDITRYQRFSQQSGDVSTAWANVTNSDYFIVDASFIRLKNLACSYILPLKWLQKAHLKEIRLFVQAQNLATVTNYRGIDPETQGRSLPPLRMLNLGLHASL